MRNLPACISFLCFLLVHKPLAGIQKKVWSWAIIHLLLKNKYSEQNTCCEIKLKTATGISFDSNPKTTANAEEIGFGKVVHSPTAAGSLALQEDLPCLALVSHRTLGKFLTAWILVFCFQHVAQLWKLLPFVRHQVPLPMLDPYVP